MLVHFIGVFSCLRGNGLPIFHLAPIFGTFASGCRRSELIHYLTIIIIKLVLRPRELFRDENYELIT